MSFSVIANAAPARSRQQLIDLYSAQIANDPKWCDIAKPLKIGGVMRFPRPTAAEILDAAVESADIMLALKDELRRLEAGEKPANPTESIDWRDRASRKLFLRNATADDSAMCY